MQIVFAVCLPRDAASVSVVRLLAGASMRELGVADECIGDIEVALTEACTNVLQHATDTLDEYEVEFEINQDSCEIRVVDTGHGFEVDAVPSDAGGEAERGRGLILMRALVDNVSFTSAPQAGTVVRLVKTLSLEDDSILTRLAPARPAVD